MASRANIDWIVMRNRVSSVEARNKRKVAIAMERALPESAAAWRRAFPSE